MNAPALSGFTVRPATMDDLEATVAMFNACSQALLRHSIVELHRYGQRKVGLGVDADSLTGATRLYEKAGMRSDPARLYYIYDKELRPGRDLSRSQIEE